MLSRFIKGMEILQEQREGDSFGTDPTDLWAWEHKTGAETTGRILKLERGNKDGGS